MNSLSITSTVALASGHQLPRLGFGVFMSTAALASTSVALKAGYVHIDSARYYHNEGEVVSAVRAYKDAGGAGDVFLTSKVMSLEHGTQKAEIAVTDSIQTAAAKGFKWDLYLLHDASAGFAKRLEAWRVLESKVASGELRSIGVSNFSEKHLSEFKKAGLQQKISVNQIELHPWCQQKLIVDYCRAEGIVVEAYCPLLRGQKFGDPTLKAIAHRVGKTEAQVLIRWSLQRDFVPLVKSDTPSRIESNAGVFGWELDAEAMATLNGLDQGDAGSMSWNPIGVQ